MGDEIKAAIAAKKNFAKSNSNKLSDEEQFKFYDKDGSGFLEEKELKKVFEDLKGEVTNADMVAADKNGNNDGKLSLDEIKAAIAAKKIFAKSNSNKLSDEE